MPALTERARRAWPELKESLAIVLEIEKEGQGFAQSEAERRRRQLTRTLRRRKD